MILNKLPLFNILKIFLFKQKQILILKLTIFSKDKCKKKTSHYTQFAHILIKVRIIKKCIFTLFLRYKKI